MGTVINRGKQALISILCLVIALTLLTPFTSRASFSDQTTAHMTFLKYLEGVADADAILPLFNFHLVGDNGFNGTFNHLDVAYLPVGNYTLTETGPAGYVLDKWAGPCKMAGEDNNGPSTQFVIKETDLGENFGCQIYNMLDPNGGGGGTTTPTTGTLVVNKVVINDNGGTTATSSFSFSVNGMSTTTFEADGSNELILTEGIYTVTEVAVSGYSASYSTGCTGTIAPNTTSICTITNNDIASGSGGGGNGTATGTLVVNKIVINDNGGTGATSSFSFSVNGASPTAFEADGTNELLVATGAYSVLEPATSGYTASYSAGCSGTISAGATSTCTITNDDQSSGGGGGGGGSSSGGGGSSSGGGGGGGGGGGSSRNSNGSNNNNNNNSSSGEVLGAEAPVGAPNTGAGGTSGNNALPLAFTLFGVGIALATLRRTQKN